MIEKTQIIKDEKYSFHVSKFIMDKKRNCRDWIVFDLLVVPINTNFIDKYILIDDMVFDEYGQLKEYLKESYNIKIRLKDFK